LGELAKKKEKKTKKTPPTAILFTSFSMLVCILGTLLGKDGQR